VTAFANWQPPEEENDDEPLLPPRSREGAEGAAPAREAEADADAKDYAELFVTVGRRDGVRAQDLLRALVEVAGLDKTTVRRIRVRDRHAFISIRKSDVESAIAKLHGTELAGRTLTVELARERGGEPQEGAAEG
jgi:ATP-dependent RNA helicase DeaD